jgi:hypothetical protein
MRDRILGSVQSNLQAHEQWAPLSHRSPSKIRLRSNRGDILREEHLIYL